MRTLIAILLVCVSTCAVAADREAKVRALMEAEGLVGLWDQQLSGSREQARQMGQRAVDQMLASINPPPEFNAKLHSLMDEYMEALRAPWTAQDIVEVWAENYASRFTDAELDDLIAFYNSPLGKKEVTATQAAMPALQNHFAEVYRPIVEKATQTFIQHLQDAVRECNCKRTG